MIIATYNINSINRRLPLLLQWLEQRKPDIVCLQELKVNQSSFPEEPLKAAGYNAIWKGQQTWNGVAILARNREIQELRTTLPGEEDDSQSRYIEAIIDQMIIGCIYLPNGNPYPGPKFDYKRRWFERLRKHACFLYEYDVPVILAGDFNVMPTELDVYKPQKYINNALYRPESREAFEEILKQGWTDAVRKLHPSTPKYSFWDYMRNAFARDAGLRLDFFLLSPHIAQRLKKSGVDREIRAAEGSSDHAPVWIEIK